MAITELTEKVSVSPQILLGIIAGLPAEGYSTLISNRPDNEEPGQPTFAEIRAAAEAAGLDAHHVPILPGKATADDIAAFGAAIDGASGKVLAFCKSGGRSQSLFVAAKG